MGAGMKPSVKRARQYRALKKVERDLTAKGIECHYKDLEVRGKNFVVYFSGVGPASNGESFYWMVLRFNPDKTPSAYSKSQGDVNYTDMHTRDIPSRELGGFDAGVKKVLESQTPVGV